MYKIIVSVDGKKKKEFGPGDIFSPTELLPALLREYGPGVEWQLVDAAHAASPRFREAWNKADRKWTVAREIRRGRPVFVNGRRCLPEEVYPELEKYPGASSFSIHRDLKGDLHITVAGRKK